MKHNKMRKKIKRKHHYLHKFCFKAFIAFTVSSFGKIQLGYLLFLFSQRLCQTFHQV